MYKNFIPQRFKDSINVLLGRAKSIPITAPFKEESVYLCPTCSSSVARFNRLPDFYYENLDAHGHIFSTFQVETLNYLQYSCPVCNASDRDRLYSLYFQKEISEIREDFRLLDIAPSGSLQNFIKAKYPHIDYRSADMMMEGVDDVVDITQMSLYRDNTFNFFICSHVLEHIDDDRKAMSELYRVLKPGAKGILMVPIVLTLSEDYENPEAKTPEDRWKYFGQDDHVRVYSKRGFIDKLSATGFTVTQLDINYFGAEAFNKHGIHSRSILYIVEKPAEF
ncbi:methyltransferase domain-containing protein [Chamaesiphon polymorphus]|uniref:SAM-dependent methyltransferase n=1 Tax=Chamaesiphon polymorphus CCALA 037 TaxID=2107692 RepID=A0A2T1GCN9_9CYAN|nr:class I SAM-dependent methyltransferase [Chamaesiphon polymorphus]PSB55170.1 SAM-dependent methyltransferase [Chamaesiphon polymorphus CCALA 037]